MMTDGELEQKLRRLSGEVAPGPSVRDAVMDQIRQGTVAAPSPRRSLPFRVLRSRFVRWFVPLAAAAAVVLAVIEFRPSPGGGHGGNGIVWASVVQNINRARTMVCWSGDETNRYKYKCYAKDPWFSRAEEFWMNSSRPAGEPPEGEPHHVLLTAGPDADWQGVECWVPEKTVRRDRFDGCPAGPIVGQASRVWKALREISSDRTKKVGESRIGNMDTVVFEADQCPDLFAMPDVKFGPVRVWVSKGAMVPVQVEINCQFPGQPVQVSIASDIKWDVPLDDSLFVAPSFDSGWKIIDEHTTCLADELWRGKMTLSIGTPENPAVITEKDISRIDVTEITGTAKMPDLELPRLEVRFLLSDEAKLRLEAYTKTHAGQVLQVVINGQPPIEGIAGPGNLVRLDGRGSNLSGRTLDEFKRNYLAVKSAPASAP